MPYISLDNLTQYNGRLRDYIDGSFDKLDGANWRKTSAAQSVSCWPIPESPLEPEVTFKFSEVPPESGDKGPDNPSTIVGVESVSCNVCESEGVNDTPYSIDLGGTYYGGTVNFATGVMEVTHNCIVFNGEEEIEFSRTMGTYTRFHFVIPAPENNYTADFACSHLVYHYNGTVDTLHIYCIDSDLYFMVEQEDLASLKTWLATQYSLGTPFTFAYKLATPYTVPLTPVLVRSLPALSHYVPRQNNVYTSHESVQVGYAKSASKTSQDLTNAITALGGNV